MPPFPHGGCAATRLRALSRHPSAPALRPRRGLRVDTRDGLTSPLLDPCRDWDPRGGLRPLSHDGDLEWLALERSDAGRTNVCGEEWAPSGAVRGDDGCTADSYTGWLCVRTTRPKRYPRPRAQRHHHPPTCHPPSRGCTGLRPSRASAAAGLEPNGCRPHPSSASRIVDLNRAAPATPTPGRVVRRSHAPPRRRPLCGGHRHPRRLPRSHRADQHAPHHQHLAQWSLALAPRRWSELDDPRTSRGRRHAKPQRRWQARTVGRSAPLLACGRNPDRRSQRGQGTA